MYRLVIVEDERDVRNRLAGMIAKSGSKFETVAEYETGIDAYDGLISDNPDLILTDIRIPYINGIELSKMVREVYPLVKIIIITGYNEFDYAKEAANLGVIGFISKPVTPDNLNVLLKKAEASLDSEFLTMSSLRDLSELSAFYKDNMPIIRENDLYRLSGMSDVAPAFEARLSGNGISLDYPYFVVCMFDFDELPEEAAGAAPGSAADATPGSAAGAAPGSAIDAAQHSGSGGARGNRDAPGDAPGGVHGNRDAPGGAPGDAPHNAPERYDIVFSSVRKFVGEEFEGLCNYDLFNRYEKLCTILKYCAPPDAKELESRLERIILRAGRYSRMPVSVGISSVFHNSKNFSAMVKEAVRALEQRSVMGGSKAFFFSNAITPASKLHTDDGMIKELGYILHTQSTEDGVKRIDIIRKSLDASGDTVYYAATGVLNALIRACDDTASLYGRYGGPDQLYRRLFEIKTDGEIFEYLKELVRFVRKLNDGVIMDNVERNLRVVTSYIEAHFCDSDINFGAMAREINFSVSYIGALLKKKLNTSFVKMLTDLRMDKAKELLTNPSLKIIDIAERLGYNDSYYFSHCFKKHTGFSPKEYRSGEQNK